MYTIRLADERGVTKTDWLISYHTFSFGSYYDRNNLGFSDLRVINDDTVMPLKGFGTHPHDNMEIISIILAGELEHRDSMQSLSVIKRGDVQTMTAGKGVLHSEMNPSSTMPVHFLQIWILTEKRNLPPSYNQKHFAEDLSQDKFHLIVSHDGREDSLQINQDAFLYHAHIQKNKTAEFQLTNDRYYWIQIAEGQVEMNGNILNRGDGIAVRDESDLLQFTGITDKAYVLLFDLRKTKY